MPISNRDLMEAISILADERNVRVTVQESAKGALICAASAFVGGLLMGPRGLVLGGALGGAAACAVAGDSFRSLGDVLLNDLSAAQQRKLAQHLKNAVTGFGAADAAKLMALMKTKSIQETVLNAVKDFISKELNMVCVG